MLIQLLSWVDRLAPHRRLIHALAGIFAAFLAASFVFDYSHWTRTEEFHGPFQRSADDAAQYVVPIGTDVPFLSIPSPQPGEVSTVRLWVNGHSFKPTEAPEPSIEQGKLWGIRGLYRTLRFSLPPGVANDAGTSLNVEYQIRMHRTVDNLIVAGAKTLIMLAGIMAYRLGNVGWMRWLVGCAAGLMPPMRLASWALILACVFYAGTIIYGLASGDALPTATVFRLIPGSRLVTTIAPFAPLLMIAFAAAGAALAWLAWLGWVRVDAVRQFELGQTQLWRICGLPVLLALFLFTLSAGGWSGYFHTTDMNYMSIAGLVPHSDSSAYFVGTFHLAYFGTWESVGTRRPMAAAFRQLITVVAGYSFTGTLLIQLALIVLALYLASSLLARWYGIWAGIGFAGLAFNIARPFLSTTMTEPLAYLWALFSLVFFIQSVRQHSLPHALVGLAALTVGLLMRMGALFAIPFMILWLGFAFAKQTASRVRLMGFAAAVVVAVLAVNFGLKHYYGEKGVDLGDNFAMVACGLSLGKDWNACTKPYEAMLSSLPNEHAVSVFLYSKAWENFLAHPSVLIGQLWANCSEFIHAVWSFMFASYISLYDATAASDLFLLALLAGIFYVWRNTPATADSFWILMLANFLYGTFLHGSHSAADFFLLALLAGIIYVWRNASVTEKSFWFAMLASIPPSAAMIMTADGWRALHVTHLFVASFLVLGLAAPQVAREKPTAPALNWQPGAVALVASLLVFLVFPAMAHALALRELRMHPPLPLRRANEEIVPGGSRLSGFLVIPDDEPRPYAVPTLHASEFAKLIRTTKLEGDFGPFLDRVLPHLPFAFVGTGRMDGPNDTNTYIAPPEVLWRKDVWAWHFTTRSWAPGEKPWYFLQDVVAAEPLP